MKERETGIETATSSLENCSANVARFLGPNRSHSACSVHSAHPADSERTRSWRKRRRTQDSRGTQQMRTTMRSSQAVRPHQGDEEGEAIDRVADSEQDAAWSTNPGTKLISVFPLTSPLPGNVVRNQVDPVNKYHNSCTARDRGLTFRASGRVVACLGY